MSNYKTLETIRTSTNQIEVISADEGRLLVVEANGEYTPFGILGHGGEMLSVVSGTAWNGGFIPESVEFLDPKSNGFAWDVEAEHFDDLAEAQAARRLHVQLAIAEQVWLADVGERMPKNVYSFVRRLLTAGQAMGVKATSAAAIDLGCRGLNLYVDGPLYCAQVVGVGVDAFGDLFFINCGEQDAPADLFRLCVLVNGDTLEYADVVFDEEMGFRATCVPPRQGILERKKTVEEAQAIAAGLAALSWQPGDVNYNVDNAAKLCRVHHPLGRYLKGDGGTCCCGR